MLIVLAIAALIDIPVSKHRAEVLKRLEYRKTACDCIMTWRGTYLTGLSLFFILFSYICCFLATFSLYSTFIFALLAPIYILFSISSIFFVKHARKVIKAYKIKDTKEFTNFIRQREVLKVVLSEKFSL